MATSYTTDAKVVELDTAMAYVPWPKQCAFHGSPARFRLFGGAQGPGKSLALLWEAIFHCLEYPGSNALLLRRTCPELDSTLIDHFQKHVLAKCPEIIGGRKAFNQTARLVRFPNGRSCDSGTALNSRTSIITTEPNTYSSASMSSPNSPLEFGSICVLEIVVLCPIPARAWLVPTNPGNANSEWVKCLWGCDGKGKRKFSMMQDYQYDSKEYEFIPASVWDNPVFANSPEYIKNLQQMSPALKAQRLEGRWDTFEGQFFSNFDPVRHVWDSRMNPFTIPYWWPRWIGIDWGFAHHTAIHWHARGKVNIDGADRMIVLTYREKLVREHTADALGDVIADASQGEKVQNIFLSPDAFARKDSHRTIALQLSEALHSRGLPHVAAADNDRVGGWNLMYQLLELDQWMIWDSCVQTIEGLPTLMRDVAHDKPEDVEKTESLADDIGDALRYGLKSYLMPRKVPEEVLHQEKLAEIHDPTAKAFYEYRHMLKQQGQQPVRMAIKPRWAQ